MGKPTYHGWILRDGSKLVAEYVDEKGVRHRLEMAEKEILAFFDRRAGQSVKLLPVPGGLRVYTS